MQGRGFTLTKDADDALSTHFGPHSPSSVSSRRRRPFLPSPGGAAPVSSSATRSEKRTGGLLMSADWELLPAPRSRPIPRARSRVRARHDQLDLRSSTARHPQMASPSIFGVLRAKRAAFAGQHQRLRSGWRLVRPIEARFSGFTLAPVRRSSLSKKHSVIQCLALSRFGSSQPSGLQTVALQDRSERRQQR